MSNIKERIRSSGVRQWEVAEKLNMSEYTLCKWLRRPEKLSEEQSSKIDKAIREIAKEKK